MEDLKLTADNVSDSWVMVLLKDKYLNSLTQATKMLNADKIVSDLEESAKGEKSACKNGLANSTESKLFTFNKLYRFKPIWAREI